MLKVIRSAQTAARGYGYLGRSVIGVTSVSVQETKYLDSSEDKDESEYLTRKALEHAGICEQQIIEILRKRRLVYQTCQNVKTLETAATEQTKTTSEDNWLSEQAVIHSKYGKQD